MITLFYGNQVCGTYHNARAIWDEYGPDHDIYQGGIVYWPHPQHVNTSWFRMDMTPIIPIDVPKETRLLAIILNL